MTDDKNGSRSLVLSSEVSDEAVAPLIERILELNDEDDNIRSNLREDKYNERPIKLIVNTYGGEAHAALALIGIIETSKTPIHTMVFGKAMSAGLWIAISGHVRFAHNLATYMYHEVADWNVGKLESQKRKIEETEKLMDMLDHYLLARTKIAPDKLKKESLTDWYFTGEEALKLGVCDYLIKVDHNVQKKPKSKGKKDDTNTES